MTAVHGTMSLLKVLLVVAVLMSWTIHAAPAEENAAEENAAAAEEDSPKQVTSGGRCVWKCRFLIYRRRRRQRIERPRPPPTYRPPPPPPPPPPPVVRNCPPTDLSGVISILNELKVTIFSITKVTTVIPELQESIIKIVNKEIDTTRIEKIIEKNHEMIKEIVRSEITIVKEKVETVETRVLNCSGSGDGSTKRLEYKIDDLAKKLELLMISQRERQEQISQTMETFSRTLQQLVKNVDILTYYSRKAVTPQTCPESPGILRLLEICQVILAEFRDRIGVVSMNIAEVQTKVVNIANSVSNIDISSGWKPDLSKLWEYLETLKTEIIVVKNSFSGEFTAIRREFTTNSQVLTSLQRTVTTTTQETSSAAASAAALELRRIAGRSLCPKQGG